MGYAGASEALDYLVCDLGVPLRIAHHEIGALVRELLSGASSGQFEAKLDRAAGRKTEVDVDHVMRVIRGENIPDTALNRPAIEATFRALKNTLSASPPRPNPVKVATDGILREAQFAVRS